MVGVTAAAVEFNTLAVAVLAAEAYATHINPTAPGLEAGVTSTEFPTAAP